MNMKLFLLKQSVNNGYDTFDSAVVCAESETQAQKTRIGGSSSWTEWENVKVVYLGEADDSIKEGIVLASFNAG